MRTEQDMGTKAVTIIAAAAIVPTFFLYGFLTGDAATAVIAGIGMVSPDSSSWPYPATSSASWEAQTTPFPE